MAVPMKNGGMNAIKVIILVILSGITTGIGAFLGSAIGAISQEIIAICLAFAAGAMLYIVTGELTPESNKLYSRKNVSTRKCIRIYHWNDCSKGLKKQRKSTSALTVF